MFRGAWAAPGGGRSSSQEAADRGAAVGRDLARGSPQPLLWVEALLSLAPWPLTGHGSLGQVSARGPCQLPALSRPPPMSC